MSLCLDVLPQVRGCNFALETNCMTRLKFHDLAACMHCFCESVDSLIGGNEIVLR